MALCLCLAALSASAQQTAPTSPTVTSLTATVTGVEGIVQVRLDENAAWQVAKIGMKLGEGAEFRTGPRSAVRFEIPPDQTITLDRLGTVKLIEAINKNQTVKTDLGMKYGRVRYDIEAAGIAHDSTIRSPGSTLAVRGTRVSLYDQPPFTPEAVSLTGQAMFRNARRQMVAFGGKGKATIRSDDNASAKTALVSSVLDTPELQRTDQQLRELNFLFTHSGMVFGNVATSDFRVTDAELPSLLGGNLDFVLRWSGPQHQAADLNIFVNTAKNEVFGNPPFILSLFPGDPTIGKLLEKNFPQSSPSGGHVGLNHIGPEGIEIASFGKNFPSGIYAFGAYNFIYSETPIDSGGEPKVPFTLEAFLNGKRQPVLLNFTAASAGTEPPRFGPVFHDEIGIGQISASAIQIKPPRAAPTVTVPTQKPTGRNR